MSVSLLSDESGLLYIIAALAADIKSSYFFCFLLSAVSSSDFSFIIVNTYCS